MRRRATLLMGIAALGLTLAGCGPATIAAPTCDGSGRTTLVLVAQSVPEAQYVPCIDVLPGGWSLAAMEVKSGHTRLQLGSAPGDTTSTYVTMDFEADCDVGAAVEVPSDDEGAQRFEDVSQIDNGYRGTRYYTFDGGCVQFAFNLRGDGWSAIVNDAASTFSLEPRAEVEQFVREYSNGVIENL